MSAATKINAPNLPEVIDVSLHTWLLLLLRIADYLLVLSSLLALYGSLSFLISDPPALSGMAIFYWTGGTVILLFSAIIGIRQISTIDQRGWIGHLLALLLMASMSSVFVISIVVDFELPTTSNLSAGDVASMVELVCTVLSLLFNALVAFSGMICLFLLRSIRIPSVELTLSRLCTNLRKARLDRGFRLYRGRRVDIGFGVLHVVVGIGLLAKGLWLFRFSEYKYLIPIIGIALLIRARGYFEARPDSLLTLDKRKPILFLRPFRDDRFGPGSWYPLTLLFNFSLETRLSKHFTQFGPFIKASSTKEVGPQVGAARLTLSDGQWHSDVTDWMSNARLIVIYAGDGEGLNWELEKAIEMKLFSRLLLLMPNWGGSKADQVDSRFEHVRNVFRETKWGVSLAATRQISNIRAMFFRADGSVSLITSHHRNRDSFHIATVIAHYMMLNQCVARLSSSEQLPVPSNPIPQCNDAPKLGPRRQCQHSDQQPTRRIFSTQDGTREAGCGLSDSGVVGKEHRKKI